MHSVPLLEYARRSLQRAYSVAQTRLRQRRQILGKRSWPRLHIHLRTETLQELGRSIPQTSAQYLTAISRVLRPSPFTPAVTAVKLIPLEQTMAYRCGKLLDTLGIRFNHKSQATLTRHHSSTRTVTAIKGENGGLALDQSIPYTHYVAPRYRPPRHPIVLCHGLFGYDKLGPDALPSLQLHYWRGIKDALYQLGAEVYVARVSGANTIAKRANELHSALSSVLAGREINFIAHSMGGLDVRHLVAHLRPQEYRVRSLTTVSTPHRGSPFMDWCRDNLYVARLGGGGGGALAASVMANNEHKSSSFAQCNGSTGINIYSKRCNNNDNNNNDVGGIRRENPAYTLAPTVTVMARQMQPMIRMLSSLLDNPAYANLTTSYLTQSFNPNTPNHPDTLYFSYGAKTSSLPLFHALRMPWEVVDAKEGDNDGLVSLSSAHWGKYLGTVDADHWELNNCWRWLQSRKHTSFDVMEFYMNIATRLHQEGL